MHHLGIRTHSRAPAHRADTPPCARARAFQSTSMVASVSFPRTLLSVGTLTQRARSQGVSEWRAQVPLPRDRGRLGSPRAATFGTGGVSKVRRLADVDAIVAGALRQVLCCKHQPSFTLLAELADAKGVVRKVSDELVCSKGGEACHTRVGALEAGQPQKVLRHRIRQLHRTRAQRRSGKGGGAGRRPLVSARSDCSSPWRAAAPPPLLSPSRRPQARAEARPSWEVREPPRADTLLVSTAGPPPLYLDIEYIIYNNIIICWSAQLNLTRVV